MQLPDLINGGFEFVGAMANFANVKILHKHKSIRGVHWGPTALFSAWGLWNLFYYPNLHQWISFIGGCFIVIANLSWLALAYKYYDTKSSGQSEGPTPATNPV